jgi:U4/U6 small nuclear ribonucleoprotein PRP4
MDEEDEDGVVIPRTADEIPDVVHFGELGAAHDADAMAEGVAKGNVHLANLAEAGERFALSAGSEETRTRQEALLREFENRRRQRAVAVTTDDREVRKQLRELGEPMTLFAEGPGERRDRLRAHLAALDAADGGALPVPDEATVVETEDVQRELFYTEGSANLMRARTLIASYSLPRASARVSLAKRRRADAAVDEIGEMDADAAATRTFKTECSQIGDERPLSVVRFSPGDGGACVMSASWSGGVRLWRTDGCERLLTVKAHENRITGADFHPTNATLRAVTSEEGEGGGGAGGGPGPCAMATACADGSAHLWSAKGALLKTLKGHANRLARCAFHPAGEHLATAGFDKTWRLWSVETGEELLCQEGHSRAVYDVAFHPDGSLCASVGLESHGKVWDLRTGKCVHNLVGHNKQCLSVDFSPNGYHVATGSDDHTAKIWDLRKRACLYTVPAHSSLISSVKYEPTRGGYFVTGSYDGVAKAWSARDFSRINSLRGHEAKVMCVDVAPGGETCATVSYDRTLKLWRLSAGGGGGGGAKREEEVVKMEM